MILVVTAQVLIAQFDALRASAATETIGYSLYLLSYMNWYPKELKVVINR